MIDRDHKLSIKREAGLLGISRGSVYYKPRPVSEVDLALMRRMDMEAQCRKPNTSKPEPGQKIYPYLLGKLSITRPNQVWGSALVAVIDWFSRKVLAWRLSIKYEEVYLYAYDSVPEARAGIARHKAFYNKRRPHSSLDRKTSDQAYFKTQQPISVAA